MAQTETPRPPGSEQSLGELVAQASKDVSALIRGELSLAKIELIHDLKRVAFAAALGVLAAGAGCLLVVLLAFTEAYLLMDHGIAGAGAFGYTALTCIFFMGLIAGTIFLLYKRLTKMRRTRTTVQETVKTLRRSDEQPEIASPIQR